MMPARSQTSLIDRLPSVRGRYEEDAPLAKLTWFRVGGPVDVLFHPADEQDLQLFMSEKPVDVPVTVLGVGSNMLVRDGGIRGVAIRLGRAFGQIDVEGLTLTAGAGATDISVAAAARDAGIAGLEFLRGVPGTIGGAVRMNAGAYGVDMNDITVSVRAIDSKGRCQEFSRDALGFSYRHCAVSEDWIFTSATLQGRMGNREEIAERMDAIQAEREETQPLRTPTGGSTFKNPDGAKAWELIEKAGCRGLRRGGAMVSEKHCNFLINTGDASAADLEGLGEEIRRRVLEETGITLEWEIHRLGEGSDNSNGPRLKAVTS
ncbi:MAG: UDP-N-acetylmuramate dehydrogenase [Rhodospirillaceae bacterium]|jgi:UDP-N-acetylmuramate dehydrogenase